MHRLESFLKLRFWFSDQLENKLNQKEKIQFPPNILCSFKLPRYVYNITRILIYNMYLTLTVWNLLSGYGCRGLYLSRSQGRSANSAINRIVLRSVSGSCQPYLFSFSKCKYNIQTIALYSIIEEIEIDQSKYIC